jgi:phosphatidylserine/phosphatidylglycerophosphate/cardiolipin synthase-like enzyme
MNQSGIPVYAMGSSTVAHAPYRYDHAKYVVIDRLFVLVVSENFKFNGFAPEGISGNRGWGVVVADPGTAEYFAAVFQADVRNPSVMPYPGKPGRLEVPSTEKHAAEFHPQTFRGATIRPILAPDTSSLVTDMINSAKTSIDIEEAYISNETRFVLNPYLSAAINASQRGVRVRVLLDSYWYNIEGMNDNDEMVALINHIADADNLPLEARLADLETSRIGKIHNKGMIIDGRQVLVSSINWNSNSPNFNRETGVIIDHPGVAAYFLTVFEDDWNPGVSIPVPGTDYIRIVIAVLVVSALVLYWYYRRRH